MMNKEYITNYLNEIKDICEKVNIDDIDKIITILFETWKNKKKVITVGNGGSASIASHFTGDLIKTVANDSSMKEISRIKGFKSICLNDNQVALTAWINDSGWDYAYSGLLHTLLDEGDVLFLFSVHGGSGWSNNLVKAMELAKKMGAILIGFSGFDGGKIKEMCDACVVVPKNSTPLVEGFQCDIQHLIIFRLREMVSSNGT